MSRSFKRTPITGYTTAESEKLDKRLANRRLRRKSGAILRSSVTASGDENVHGVSDLPRIREVSNVYTFDKDGKQWLDEPDPKDLRK